MAKLLRTVALNTFDGSNPLIVMSHVINSRSS